MRMGEELGMGKGAGLEMGEELGMGNGKGKGMGEEIERKRNGRRTGNREKEWDRGRNEDEESSKKTLGPELLTGDSTFLD